MKKRTVASAGFLTVVIAIVSSTAMLGGSQGRPASPQTANRYVAPRTPWGDPDLQGNLTNLYEVGTPLERPDEFAGRKLDDVKGEELTNIRPSIQERTRAD